MRAHLKKYFIISAAVLLLTAWGTVVHAVDPPHVAPKVTCKQCHSNGAYNAASGGNIDNTPMNMLCQFCHKNTAGITKAVTHSSNEVGGSYTWTYECRECHNPHYQEQARTYKSSYGSGGSWLAFGAIVNVTDDVSAGIYNVVTIDSSWPANKWVGYNLVGNRTFSIMYRIANSSADTLTVESPNGSVNMNYVKIGTPYAVTYGTLFRANLNTRKAIINSGLDGIWDTADDQTIDPNTVRPVRLLNATGPKSLADSITEADAACVVCHTRTTHMNIGYTLYPTSFDDFVTNYANDDHTANTSSSNQCWDQQGCHVQHEKAFSGGAKCGVCHGTILDGLDGQGAPDLTADLVIKLKDNGNLINTVTGANSVYAHPAHLGTVSSCYICHEEGMNPKEEDAYTGNYKIEINFGGIAADPGATYSGRSDSVGDLLENSFVYNGTVGLGGPSVVGDGNMQCDTIYCHSDGGNYLGTTTNYTSPRWNDGSFSFPNDCNKCHGSTSTGEYVITDRHRKHVRGNAGEYTYNCQECHADTVDSALTINTDNGLHVDGTKDVVFGGVISTIGSPSGTYPGGPTVLGNGTCSSIYCHSNADPVGPGVSKQYADAIWGESGKDCGYCHSKQGASSPTWSLPHTRHVNDYAGRFYCADCHSGIATAGTYGAIADTSLHVDGIKNVVFAGGGTYNSADNSCTNVSCHSQDGVSTYSSTPYWTDGSGVACDYCHGGAKGQSAMESEARLSTAHFEHIANTLGGDNYGSIANRTSMAITCDFCHKGTTDDGLSINAGGLIANHVDFSPTVNFEFSVINGTTPPAYGATCSVYCHGSAMPYNSNSGTSPGVGQTPGWGETNYITGAPANDCGQCHGAPPLGYTGSSHNVSMNFKDCSGCHEHVYKTDAAGNGWILNGTAFADISLHINGISEAAGCTGCHGQPPLDTPDDPLLGAGSSASTQRDGQNGWFAEGAHGTHNDAGFGTDNCDKCHFGGGDALDNHASSLHINMGFTHVLTQGTYSAPQFNNASYSVVETAPTTVNYPSGTQRQCSNIYCHGDAGPSTPVYATPAWDDTFSYPTDCDQCHGDGLGTGNYVETSKHPKHVSGGAGQYTYTCEECHTLTTDETMTRASLDTTLHVNGTKDVDFGTDSAINDSGSWATNQCSNTYCHSYGDKNAAPYNGPVTTADWTGSMPGDCTGCHGNDAGTGSPMGTVGSTPHTAHINSATLVGKNIGCAECHKATASTNQSLIATTYHVNRELNVQFDNSINKNGDGPTYNSQDTTVAGGGTAAPGAVASCSNVYCHSVGNLNAPLGSVVADPDTLADFRTISWSGSIGCDGCHGNQANKVHPTYTSGLAGSTTANSHVAHVETSGLACDICHIQTTTHTLVPPTFVTDGGSHLDRTESVDFKSIGGKTGTYQADKGCDNTYCHGVTGPQWGGASLYCNSCHAASTDTSPELLSDRHDKHYNSTTVATGLTATNTHTGTAYVFGCGNCHPNSGSHATGPVPPGGTQDAEIGGTNLAQANYNPGGSSTTDAKNFNYTVGGTCTTYCHSSGSINNDASSPHYVSTVAWSDTYTGACNVCHDADAAPAISTNSHTVHVDNATHNFTCEECHGGTVTGNSTMTTASQRSNHVNGTNNVVWKTGGVNDGSTAYADPNCNSMYCHSDGTSLSAASPGTPATTPVVWGNTFSGASCDDCHTGGTTSGPTYANGSLKENSHAKHVTTFGYDCEDCHSTVIDTDGVSLIYPATQHIDKTYDVVAGGTYSFTYTAGNPGSCSNISCHGGAGANADWGATLVCTDCHGTTGTETEDFGTGTAASINDGSVVATINTNEWNNRGHGLDSGNLPSGNPAPNLLSGATNKCLACHDDAAAHELDTNPFRLRNVATVNQVCMNCHDTDSGTAPGVSGFRKPTQAYVENNHYNVGSAQNARHSASTYNGGRFCWDCHDPHGTPNTTFMMGQGPNEKLTRRTTSTGGDVDLGIPFGGTSGSVGDSGTNGRTSAAVAFTPTRGSETATDFITNNSSFDANKLCETCHDSASGLPYYGLGNSGNHNSGQKCIQCHTHTNGFIGQGGDCIGCHGSTQGSRRAVVGEFAKQAHHVSSTFNGGTPTTLSAADCVPCHLEGDANGDSPTPNATYHTYTPGPVNLRNADNPSDASLTYNRLDGLTAAEHQNRDKHCLSCHDQNGASDATARTQATQRAAYATALKPFGDDITNGYDQLNRTRVVDVYDQFYPGTLVAGQNPSNSPYDGNASHHAVRGRRYTTGGTQYLYTNSFMTNNPLVLSGETAIDSALLSCGDCHTGADPTIGIHGSANEYMLRRVQPSNPNAYATTDGEHTYTAADAGVTSDLICFYCHTKDRYRTKETGHAGNASDFDSNATTFAATGAARMSSAPKGKATMFAYPCAHCHNAGDVSIRTGNSWDTVFGGIHGGGYTYQDGNSPTPFGTWSTYRFMPGLSNNGYYPGEDVSLTGTPWDEITNMNLNNACYTNPNTSYSACTQHTGGTTMDERHLSRPLSY